MPEADPTADEGSPAPRKRRRISADEKLLLDRIKARESGQPQTPESGQPALSPRPTMPPPPKAEVGGLGAAYRVDDSPPKRQEEPGPQSPLRAFFAHPLVRGALRLLKLMVRASCLLYLVCLIGVAWAMNEYGQANVTTATLMYLPPLLWLMPVFFLIPAALLFDWKSLVLLLLGTGWYLTGHLHWQLRGSGEPPAPEPFAQLRLLSWNRGQSGSTSLGPIKEALKPDYILLQDAAGRGGRYRHVPEYREFREFVDAGEFVLMSRWPVLGSQNLTMTLPNGTVTNLGAARFIVLHAGRRVVLYNIHLPSP
ncbi:MAG: hypothetical protein LDL31_06875, partial [Prosthecobacter sp.]|nr:hypothetical protein [Prosthecobacter sp.]